MGTRTTRWVGLGLLVLAVSGCGSMTAEDFKAVLGGLTDLARTANDFETQRRAARAGAMPSQPAAVPTQAAQAVPTYGALSCTRPSARNGMACFENACGRQVSLHARASNGAMGSFHVPPGQCAPMAPGTVAFACAAGDRFDWQRASCVGS